MLLQEQTVGTVTSHKGLTGWFSTDHKTAAQSDSEHSRSTHIKQNV